LTIKLTQVVVGILSNPTPNRVTFPPLVPCFLKPR